MAIYVVDSMSKIDDTEGVIVVRSDKEPTEGNLAYPELQGPATRRLAIMHAAQLGLPDPRIKGTVSVYPVDANDKEVTDPRKQIAVAFQADVPVTRRLV